jgi:hypothetical protein
VCDACNEQFQGFRAEELDEEYASRMTVFRRTSQSSRAERKRLVAEAENARTALKISASQTETVDASRLISEGVVVISRAIVDSLVAGGYAPKGITRICFKVISHWLRMCHMGAGTKVKGLSLDNFSANSILAFISLAAVFVRSSLLPRDLCVLAVQRKIPFLTASVELLDPHFLHANAVRKALNPPRFPIARDITRLANAIATSEFAWPPLRPFFNGDAVIYKHWAYSSFPLGQYELTLSRTVRLLGLPDDFCARVHRYRELRRVATAMNIKIHALERERRSKRISAKKVKRFDTGHEDARDPMWIAGPAFMEETDIGDGAEERQNGTPLDATGRGPWAPDQFPQDHDSFVGAPVAQPCPDVKMAAEFHESEGPHKDYSKKNPPASKKRQLAIGEELSLHTYELENDVSSWPFSAPADHRRRLLYEFPTNRTLLVDILSTMRICYGVPSLNADIKCRVVPGCSNEDKSDTACPTYAREWTFCLRRMQSMLNDTNTVTEAISWTGLSPTAIDCIKGASLSDFLKISASSLQGALPLFMNDYAEQFEKLGEQTEKRGGLVAATNLRALLSEGSRCDPDIGRYPESSSRFDDFGLIGRWLWDNNSRSHGDDFSIARVYGVDLKQPAKRHPLLPALGHSSDEMRQQKVRRRMIRSAKAGKVVWADPVGIDFALIILQRFFLGSFANIGGVDCETPAANDELRTCLDSAMRVVINYVSIHLGEEGSIRESFRADSISTPTTMSDSSKLH